MKLTNPFRKKKNHYQVISENPHEPLKSIVRFNNRYVMWLGTAKVNMQNPLPVEEWLAEHFMFQDQEGNLYADESAGLRYSSNMKFKFAPSRFADVCMAYRDEQNKQEQTQEEKDEIFNRSYELPEKTTDD